MSPSVMLALPIALFTFAAFGSTFQQGTKSQGRLESATKTAHPNETPHTDHRLDDFQLSNIEVSRDLVRHSLSDSMQQTLDMIKNVESLPSCAKIASSALLHSCSALEGSIAHDESNYTRGSDLFVEEEANVFAARLAVCELNGAEIPTPAGCQAFVPTHKTARKRGIRGVWSKRGTTKPNAHFEYYDEITQANLKQCQKALGLTSQSWTSYSNNRQNAVVMCRAMRGEIEKDEQLHIGKILASAAVDSTRSMHDMREELNRMEAQFSQLTSAIPQYHKDLVAGNEQQQAHLEQFYAKVQRINSDLDKVFASVDTVTAGILGANNEVDYLRTSIHGANDATDELRDSVASGIANMAELTGKTSAASEVIQYQSYQVERGTQAILQMLGQTGQSLDAINAVAPKIRHEMMAIIEEQAQMHAESRQIHNASVTILKQFHQNAESLNATIGSVATLLNAGWPGAFVLLKTAAAFLAYTVVYSLLSFGSWEALVSFSFLGNVSAAIATGLGKCGNFGLVNNVLTI